MANSDFGAVGYNRWGMKDISVGKFKGYKIDKEYRIEKSEFERFMSNTKTN